MAIVVDANLVVVLVSRDPRAAAVDRHLQSWLTAGEDLHAPHLLRYEVANGLTRLVVSGRLPLGDAVEAWREVDGLPITLHGLDDGTDVVRTAILLGRQSAYDAAYLALARQLGALLWTLDGPLARNASGLGFPVNLISR